ncbi:hypothetical protein HHK36_017154 [Tetracentron sinense]|uniref:Small acidic protein-like domain-containing protein n=1 Tax=Tetracentron sinense TaxID=13715 RepID=A0A834Z4P3_TETSI|nr:hypothetical protein HHK36_017154 [Tetracentron sinense]
MQSLSRDNADSRPSFRKPSNDAVNRKYRRHSPVSGSSSSGGSPKHGRSPSPFFSREDPSKISDNRRRSKDTGRDLDRDSARNRYSRSSDSNRHSDRQSYRSSYDYPRHDNYSRHQKHADEGERNYHRLSSRSGRESRDGTHSDHTKQEGEHPKSREYWRDVDKYSRDKPDGAGNRSKDKERGTIVLERHKNNDKDSSSDRGGSGRKPTSSNMEEIYTGDRDIHNRDRGGGRDDKRDHQRSSGDYKKDQTSSFEQSRGHGKGSTTGRDNDGHRLKETYKSDSKEMDGQKDATMEKRKHDGRDAEKHKERYNREPEAHVKNGHGISSGGIERDERNEQYQGKTICVSEDEESSAKKPKLFNSDKRTGYVKDADERPSLSSKQVQETVCKVTSEHAHSFTSEAEAANDLNAAKVAAMKAAELVNRNLIGGGYMSTDQKKKLLWGNKKNTTAEESGHCWDMPLFSDRERQEKFNKLMGVKGEVKLEHKPDDQDGSALIQTEKQKELQLDLEKQYTAGLRRRDGRTNRSCDPVLPFWGNMFVIRNVNAGDWKSPFSGLVGLVPSAGCLSLKGWPYLLEKLGLSALQVQVEAWEGISTQLGCL